MKYKGYIERERMIAEKMHRLKTSRSKVALNILKSMRYLLEARQKLEHIDPETLAQASRIPGVSPSDINVMLILFGR